MQQRLFGYGFVVATLGVILLLTLSPTSAEPTRATVWCLACGQLGGRDLVLNVLLFIPLGFALAVAGVRGRIALPLMMAVTLAIELLQMHIVAGRDASLGDLVANAAGGSVGHLVGTHRDRLLRPPPALARRFTVAAATCALGLLLATAWGVQPSLPRTRYYAQWAADMSNFGRFTGSILSARAGNERFPPIGEIDAIRHFRERLLTGRAPLVALVVPSAAQEPRLSPILSVFDHHRQEIVLLGQEERDIVFRMRTRSADARFPSVGVRLRGTFVRARGDLARQAEPVLVAGGRSEGRIWALGSREGEMRRTEIVLGPELGWLFLIPWHYELGRWTSWLSAMWLATIFLPFAYWSAMCPRSDAARWYGGVAWQAIPGLVAVLALGALPPLLGLQVAGPLAWLSGALACAAGWMLGTRSERQRHPG